MSEQEDFYSRAGQNPLVRKWVCVNRPDINEAATPYLEKPQIDHKEDNTSSKASKHRSAILAKVQRLAPDGAMPIQRPGKRWAADAKSKNSPKQRRVTPTKKTSTPTTLPVEINTSPMIIRLVVKEPTTSELPGETRECKPKRPCLTPVKMSKLNQSTPAKRCSSSPPPPPISPCHVRQASKDLVCSNPATERATKQPRRLILTMKNMENSSPPPTSSSSSSVSSVSPVTTTTTNDLDISPVVMNLPTPLSSCYDSDNEKS